MGFDINNSPELQRLNLSAIQLKNLDKLDGEDGEISNSVFEAAEAYLNGEFADGSETRDGWMQKLGDMFKPLMNALNVEISKNENGTTIKTSRDTNSDGKPEVTRTRVVNEQGEKTGETVAYYNNDGTLSETRDIKYNENGDVLSVATDNNADGDVDELVENKYDGKRLLQTNISTYNNKGKLSGAEEMRYNEHGEIYHSIDNDADGNPEEVTEREFNEWGEIRSTSNTKYKDGKIFSFSKHEHGI